MKKYVLQSDAKIVVRVLEAGLEVEAKGKMARFLRLSIFTGDEGFNSGEAVPALGPSRPHVAGAKQRLQDKGLPIRKENERIGPNVTIARYFLDGPIEIIEDWSDAF